MLAVKLAYYKHLIGTICLPIFIYLPIHQSTYLSTIQLLIICHLIYTHLSLCIYKCIYTLQLCVTKPACFLKNALYYLFSCMYECPWLCLCAWVYACACRCPGSQKRAADPLQLEWEFQKSKGASTFRSWAISWALNKLVKSILKTSVLEKNKEGEGGKKGKWWSELFLKKVLRFSVEK